MVVPQQMKVEETASYRYYRSFLKVKSMHRTIQDQHNYVPPVPMVVLIQDCSTVNRSNGEEVSKVVVQVDVFPESTVDLMIPVEDRD